MSAKISRKRYQLFGKPTGVIAISVKSRVQCLIMSALRLAFMKRREKIKRSNSSNNSINMPAATATDDDIQLDHGNDNDNIFYTAAANAFDHSPTVREYFHNNRSRTQSDNKSLWPLRYQAYKEYGV